MEHWENKHIVFFDRGCGVCNFWVQWIIKRDTKDQFMFASLQSDFGQQFLSERALQTNVLNTIYLWKPTQYYMIKSRAILKITDLLGGIYRLSAIGKILPVYIGDKMYDIISKNRMKLSNRKCYLPDQHQKKKFIQI